jgi:hypothetical protein
VPWSLSQELKVTKDTSIYMVMNFVVILMAFPPGIKGQTDSKLIENLLWDEISIGLGELCVNKKSAAKYVQGY